MVLSPWSMVTAMPSLVGRDEVMKMMMVSAPQATTARQSGPKERTETERL